MRKLIQIAIIVLLISNIKNFIFPQVENIPSGNKVYSFLARMYAQGVLNEYDDIVLPMSRKQIAAALKIIENQKSELTTIDQKLLNRLMSKLGFNESLPKLELLEKFPEHFFQNLSSDFEKHLYFFDDSTINFYIDPMLEYKLIYSDESRQTASLINFGGRIRGSFGNWFGYYVSASNGAVLGNRITAKNDKRIEQSFTFNNTKINYFDNTEGYLQFEKDIFGLQLGRERILWGAGQVNKLILSDNPQQFDFIRFDMKYKSITYDFLHGWLVMPAEFFKIGNEISKEKRSKYIAISRLGFIPCADLAFGISQTIIYSNRAFELAYLNPFLFWESAQRSLNDLDNSFLSVDGRWRPTAGLRLNASAIVDDINLERLFNGEWAGHNNGFAWQAGVSLASPLVFDQLALDFEYLQLRPYIFSHPGYGESLTYTNNGHLLGVDLNPNSSLFSFRIIYDLTDRINLLLIYKHLEHGNNEYDSLGNRTKNVGGNFFEYYTINDSKFAFFLDGVREIENSLQIGFSWEFFNGFYFKMEWLHRKNSLQSNLDGNIVYTTLKLDLD